MTTNTSQGVEQQMFPVKIQMVFLTARLRIKTRFPAERPAHPSKNINDLWVVAFIADKLYIGCCYPTSPCFPASNTSLFSSHHLLTARCKSSTAFHNESGWFFDCTLRNVHVSNQHFLLITRGVLASKLSFLGFTLSFSCVC